MRIWKSFWFYGRQAASEQEHALTIGWGRAPLIFCVPEIPMVVGLSDHPMKCWERKAKDRARVNRFLESRGSK